jgi:hypothetical protein
MMLSPAMRTSSRWRSSPATRHCGSRAATHSIAAPVPQPMSSTSWPGSAGTAAARKTASIETRAPSTG